MPSVAAGNKVWVPAQKRPDENPYELAEVLSTDPLKVFLVADGTFSMPKESEVSLANVGTEVDNCNLLMISDATLLANTCERFVADSIYTFTGTIVTSVNPCKPLPELYSEAAMGASLADRHSAKAPQPHIFHTAESAYETLLSGGRDQSIVVSGISGAGKTEAIKYIMRYLCWRSAQAGGSITSNVPAGNVPSSGGNTLSDLIMLSNPVFESLGNATTVNNPNSSRFGKFIRMRFEHGAVQGALIDTYLLEKSRLASQQAGERNFHIFYQVLAGATDDTLTALSLPRDGPFKLLGGGKSPFAHVGVAAAANDVSDAPPAPTPDVVRQQMAADFAETTAAMSALGIDASAAASLVAALLHLGNIDFEPLSGEHDEGCQVRPAASKSLDTAARLLGIETLSSLLTARKVQAGGGRRSQYETPLTVLQAAFTRDALAKKLYEGLFATTVGAINSVLGGAKYAEMPKPTSEQKSANPSAGWVGLLDVFGFEIFARNGFEQLMVNLANERLQRFFLEAIFRKEQAEYDAEALPWVPIVDVPDNSDCIATIESKPYGVLPLLDEQCRLGERGTDGALCQLLNSKNSACIAAAEALGQKGRTTFRPDETFTIRHFVQPVTYAAAEFLERNKDTFYHDLARAVATSSNAYVRTLIDESKVQTVDEVALSGVGKSYNTVALEFTTSLAGLLDELSETDAGFVRCIKPNAALAPNHFHATMALHQLRTCGMVQAVRMMMAMYGARIAYTDIASCWGGGKSILPEPLRSLEPKEFVIAMCKVFDVPIHEYAFGTTKLFFRAGQAVGLSAFCREAPSEAEAIVRSTVLLWKMMMSAREERAARRVASWLVRARTKLNGAAYAFEKQKLYLVGEARLAAERAGSGLTAVGVVTADADVDSQYVAAMALRYRGARRDFAVECVRARAATRIQKMLRAMAGRETTRAWRHELKVRAAALRVTKVARGHAGRKRFKNEYENWVERVTPSVKVIQSAWRATAPKRFRRAAIAGALLIQCTYRMSRIKRLHQRLVQAILFLKKGAVLQKYRARHVIGERHARYVRLNDDLTTLTWLPPGKEDKEPDPNEKLTSLMMTDIQAVTDGAKTGLMKKMFTRADGGGSVFEKMIGLKPHELELQCAFSLIVKDRTIDFVAPATEARDAWLQHLNILLVHQRTHGTDKVLGRKDVLDELHTMSFAMSNLMRSQTKAKERVRQGSMHITQTKKAISRIASIIEEESTSS